MKTTTPKMKNKATNIGSGFGWMYRGLLIKKSVDNYGTGTSSCTPYSGWSIASGDLFGGIKVPADIIKGAPTKKDAINIINKYFYGK